MKFHLVTAKISADADGPHEFSEFVASQADAATVRARLKRGATFVEAIT